MKYLKKPAVMKLWKVIVLDLLALGLILVTFALFHHVLPRYMAANEAEQEQLTATEINVTEPEQTDVPDLETVSQTEPPTEPDTRTEWQIKFADHFTEEVVRTENSYTSQEVSITIETVVDTYDNRQVTYYVADIYVAGIENFKTAIANGKFTYYGDQAPLTLAEETGAILSVNGDFATVHKKGFIVRNSTVYLSDLNKGVCVMYPDGTMETYDQGTYLVEDILSRDPVHVWSFGPSLLDAEGKALTEFKLASGIGGRHPRCAVGYYEPGHYCFVLVDGRQSGYSDGITMPNLASIFEKLGCKVAYNLDGGRSAVMMFGTEFYSQPYLDGRDLGDILYIAETGLYTKGAEGAMDAAEEAEVQSAATEVQEVTE